MEDNNLEMQQTNEGLIEKRHDRNETTSTNGDSAKLEREVGLISGITLIVGTMIGSGIFISPKGVLEGTGSVGLSLVIWAACGLLVTMSALCYAELGAMIPASGGEHSYLMYTFGKRGKCFGPVPAFLYDWVGLFIIRPTMFAIMSLSLGTYAVKPFFLDCDPPESVVKIVTTLAMVVIAFVNGFNVKMATTIQNVCTVIKLIAIGILTVGGIYKIAIGNTDNIGEGFQDTQKDLSLIAIAFYNGLWAFDGWNNLNFVTEELRNPSRNLPLAIMIGIPLTTVCYILANVGYLGVMSKQELLVSHAVAVTWSNRMLGVMAWCMPVLVSISCFGAANGCLFASGRLCFAASREGHFPRFLSFISVSRKTPLPSIMLTAFMGICLIIPGDLSTLIDFYSFSAWIAYGVTTICLLVLRYSKPDLERPYKVPLFVPLLVVIISGYLVLAPVIQSPKVQFLYAVLFILSGLFVYFPLVYNKKTRGQLTPMMDWVTLFSQKVLMIIPCKED